MKAKKIKSKPIVFSMQTKMFFQTNKQMRKPSTQLSTNHWFSTNQTHSESEVRENGFAKKSQETKVKTQRTRKTLKP
jgi:hypothetical protein